VFLLVAELRYAVQFRLFCCRIETASPDLATNCAIADADHRISDFTAERSDQRGAGAEPVSTRQPSLISRLSSIVNVSLPPSDV